MPEKKKEGDLEWNEDLKKLDLEKLKIIVIPI